jgi:hypothetical protein
LWHPTIQDTPQSINSAIGTGNKSADWLFTVVAMWCVIGLLVAFTMVHSSSFQPSVEQISLLLG